ncbi:hypothetical protein [Microbacterium sp. 69-10]|nr:hypothetical protein [Microbacterium sp. 69-10]
MEFWRERMANAERIGRPAHIEHVRARLEGIEALVRADETKES